QVYIDGSAGTTGLQIYERLGARDDITLLTISPELHRDVAERKRLLNEADLVFLCLPDAAAIEAVGLIENPDTRVIDASTAHRVSPDWDYGFPELSYEMRDAIVHSKRVANPGCYASGFISIVYPLVKLGIVDADTPLTAWGLSGYSGGGKKMIASYESPEKGEELFAPCHYALNGDHKHIPEMMTVCGLTKKPVFNPIVDDYLKGMEVAVPLHQEFLNGYTADQIHGMLFEYYRNAANVSVDPERTTGGTFYANALAGTDQLILHVTGNDERVTVTAHLDNLGKGASGAAVQNMNLMLGFDETAGLK
ncbi:MAG: N-acetyl-gamma-glutamyl-phosphate reductase, partial [Clostridia bacterium]|nr:N-acetyl-gamma-glutamyl-phosphate reductase [Clostridia bacterium]